ncbi:MAG: flavin reductase [Hyphomicrobiales bacterium]|nr:flavin reductase [Hyphomicrobiales bacterium]
MKPTASKAQESEATSIAVAGGDYRDAMSRIVGAVHVVASDGPAGAGGATMTAVTSVTDAPPTVLICLNRTGRLNALLRANGVFSVNTLVEGDENLAGVFAGVGGVDHPDRFAHGRWERGATGAPLLCGARAALDCRITQSVDVGSHTVFFGLVEAVRIGDARPPLLYVDRAYRVLPTA